MATAEKEYIERVALIKFIKKNTPNLSGNTTMRCVERVMKAAPAAADVVEVVRCEKCKHGQRNNIGPGAGSYMCEHDHGEVLRSPRHFCGYGERWEDET